MGFSHLHTRSWYSFLRGASSPESLVQAAHHLGQPALALTDFMTVAGAVKFQQAAQARGIKPIIGAEVILERHPVVLLCASNAGYATLCRLLSCADERRTDAHTGFLEFDDLADDHADLFLLTGGSEGFLRARLERLENHTALEWLKRLSSLMPGRVFVELSSHRKPGEGRMVGRLAQLARTARVPLVATNDARYGSRDDFPLHDLLSCVRLKITVHDDHPERPVGDEAFLKPLAEIQELIWELSALANTLEIARQCAVDLLPGAITPPGANLPDGVHPDDHLERLCRDGLRWRYPEHRFPREHRAKARTQLEHELGVIAGLELSEFFLVVQEVVAFARSRGIRCAGRGSAANSIVAYLLGVTGVDPLEQGLLFERFLHASRKGTPDIDVDFDTERRGEVIAWLEQRFQGQTAMTANINTYQPKSAVADAAKALGWPLETVRLMTKALPHHGRCRSIKEHRSALEGVIGSSPLLEVLLEIVSRMDGCPRHLSQHSGGMLLTRDAITDHTPLIRSANGVMTAVFDKEDVEDMGLVKFDVLGLRAMSAISTALELHEQATGERLEVDDIPLDDPRIYDLICDGKTVGLFQVESPGQIALIARHQPRTFKDLIAQIALLRPGPLQGGMVHPYVRRSRGEEEVTFLHPSLEEVLKDTHGIIVYQESVLRVAHAFAGLSFEQADEFRRLMSRWRDPGEMAGMREVFVRGALETHPNCTVEVAEEVFRLVSQFVGYGFPKSHSAAFAKTVYQTAFLKAYHPAAYFAAVMQHRPGMYPLESLITEARWSGVKVLPPSLEHSSLGFSLEPHGRFPNGRPRLAIRLPLEGVNGVGVADARQLLLERTVKPFASLEDLWRRVRVSRDALESLAQAGTLESFGERREVLWGLGVLETQYGPPGGDSPLLETPAVTDLPDLKTLTALERASWDFRTLHASAGPHPIALLRPWLNRAGVTPIHRITFDRVTVAGLVVVRQRPPTAKGVVFITLEDETGRVQCVAHPGVWERISKQLKQPSLIVVGAVTRVGNWRGITVEQGFALEARVPGGRAGSPRA